MIFFNAFLFAGIVCLIGEIILDNTNFSAGHITSLFTVIGAILGFLGLYPKIIEKCGAGATVLITNFGASLYESGMQGYFEKGILGVLDSLLSKSSLVIVGTIVISSLLSIFFKPRN